MTKKKQKLVHLLITLNLDPSCRLHSYVICPKEHERDVMENVAERMFQEAESKGIQPWPGIVLSTTLGDAVGVVRDILEKQFPQTKKDWNKVKEFNLTMWAMPTANPDDPKLMELH